MDKEDIHLWDWERLLLGDAPREFMAEVFVRTLVMYIILIVVLRLFGKRMSAQLSITEMAVMITLGAIIAVPMQIPDRGMLPAIVVLLCALLFQRGLNWLTFINSKFENIAQGKTSLLVAEGCMELKEMKKTTASREQVFAVLRNKNVQHLGQVKRLYLEPSGKFSLFRNEDPLTGLSVLPLQDEDLLTNQPHDNGHYACNNCGNTVESDDKPNDECSRCGANMWTQAFSLIPENHNDFTLKEADE
ncbi:DUF421 domain-containing protein [Pontibacter diazotrophicus]|uniref:DUF421 domain-containing protein n=1 Tax=Pontibacter diazotrophicus TaxID=1400979 RepID=A0A3D8LH72_9BACT|nr:YetF domain-containing protein [Pontibacter diazotrophicus]RDV16584.1 DUF421 domain-containing protein [Pontibacter diazotrophicus]